MQNGPIVFHCEKACVFGHGWMFNLGHFINDYLSPLMLVPEEFLDECVVILSVDTRKFGEDILKAVGVKKYIYLSDNEWVHADKLAVAIEGRPHIMHYGAPTKKLVDYLRIYFRTIDIIGTRYVIMNRNMADRRHINNIKEVVNAVKSNIKDVEFEEIEDRLGSIESYVRFYPSILCVFMPVGSNTFKTIFMNPNSVVIIASNEMFDFAAICTVLSCEIRVVHFVHAVPHNDCFNVDIEIAVKAIKVAVYSCIHGEFPIPETNISFIDYIQ